MKEVARLISGDGRCVVALSAMSGTTNRLLGISESLLRGNKEEACRLLHTLKADYAAVIDELYDSAATTANAVAAHPEARVLLTQGFICRNAEGGIDNLRRGGSNYHISFLVEKENKTKALRCLSNHLFNN